MLTSRRRIAACVLVALAIVPLSACATTVGGHGSRAAADFPRPTNAVTPTATTSAPGTGPADDLVRRARNALLTGGDMVLDATLHDQADLHVTGRYAAGGASVVVTVGSFRIEVLGIDNLVYVRAPAAYWKTVKVDGADAVTGTQWVQANDPDSGPGGCAGLEFLESLLLPDSADTLSVARDTTVGGQTAAVVQDADGWQYTITEDAAKPHVVHVEHTGEATVDVTYPTDTQTFSPPDPASVVTLAGY